MTGSSGAAADIAEQPDVLSRVIRQNSAQLSAALDAIAGARVVRFAALGSSKHAAGYGAACLETFCALPAVVLPAPGAAVPLPQPRPDEPLVVLSQSGATPALITVVKRASRAGVTVLAITNEPGSPLEDIADITLACDAGPERVVAATKSVTAQCLLLRALAKEPSHSEISSLVRAVHDVLSLDMCAALGTQPPSAVVAAGFASEWIADEIALKLAEMCGLPVTSESLVEHFHGPRAAGAPTVAFLAGRDPNAAGLSRDVSRIGPDESFDVLTPTVGDASLDAIVSLVVGQRLALTWAAKLGVDPDADRGLSKVTGTR